MRAIQSQRSTWMLSEQEDSQRSIASTTAMRSRTSNSFNKAYKAKGTLLERQLDNTPYIESHQGSKSVLS